MTSPEVRPADGAADGSLHWVEHPIHGKRVWSFCSNFMGFGAAWVAAGERNSMADFLYRKGWRYLHPASPADASDLAAAREEIEQLQASRNEWREAYGQLDQNTSNRIAELEAALEVALGAWIKLEPSDSRAVSNEFVAAAAVLAKCSTEEGLLILRAALAPKGGDDAG